MGKMLFKKTKVYHKMKKHINIIRFFSIYEAYIKGKITRRQRNRLLKFRTI